MGSRRRSGARGCEVVTWHRGLRNAGPFALVVFVSGACSDVKLGWERMYKSDDPVQLPVLSSQELPFRYPGELFAQQIQGDVTLRLYIDSLGSVVPESTQVAEHATLAAFDSAALGGSSRLMFRPARRGDRRIGYTVLFPIKFRVPGAPKPPEDTMRVRK